MLSDPTDAQELARLRAVEAALIEELNEPGAITKDEIRKVLATKAPVDSPPPDPDPEPEPGVLYGPRPDVPRAAFGSITVKAGQELSLTGADITGRIRVEKGGKLTLSDFVLSNTGRYPIENYGELHAQFGTVIGNTDPNDSSRGYVLASNTAALLKGRSTLLNIEFLRCGEGPRVEGDDVEIGYCWVHHLVRVPKGHHDGVQIRKGVGIWLHHLRLDAYNPDTRDPMNASIQIGSALGDVPVSGLLVEDCDFNGGNYTINGGTEWVTQAIYRRNRFGRNFRYGTHTNMGAGSVWESSNVWADTGEPV